MAGGPDSSNPKASAASIRAKHPDRIPVIVDKREGDSSLPDIDKVRLALSVDRLLDGRARP